MALRRVALRFGRMGVLLKPPLPHRRTGRKGSTCRRGEAETERTCAAPGGRARGRGVSAARGQRCSGERVRCAWGVRACAVPAAGTCRAGLWTSRSAAPEVVESDRRWCSEKSSRGPVQSPEPHRRGPRSACSVPSARAPAYRLRVGAKVTLVSSLSRRVGSCTTRFLGLSGGLDQSAELILVGLLCTGVFSPAPRAPPPWGDFCPQFNTADAPRDSGGWGLLLWDG